MMRLMRGTLLLLAAGAVGGLLDWGPSGGFSSAVSAKPPDPKGRAPKGPEKGKDHLQKAYDDLTDVSVWMNVDRARPPRDTTKLFDRATTLYRDAVKASREDEGPRADELGLAAHDDRDVRRPDPERRRPRPPEEGPRRPRPPRGPDRDAPPPPPERQ